MLPLETTDTISPSIHALYYICKNNGCTSPCHSQVYKVNILSTCSDQTSTATLHQNMVIREPQLLHQ